MTEIEIRPEPEDLVVFADRLPAVADALPPSRNPFTVYIESLSSPESRRTMTCCLRYVAKQVGFEDPADMPWHLLQPHIVKRLKALMVEESYTDHSERKKWSPSTVNKHLAAVRGVVTTAWEIGLMDTDTYMRIKSEKGVKGDRLPAGRSIADEELTAMLKQCIDGSLIGIRNAAILAVLASTGARRAEVAGARREHYDPGTRTLRIIGKGNKEREVHLTESAAVYLGAWLSQTDEKIGPMFGHVNRWGKTVARHLTTNAIGLIIDKVRKDAGLPKLTTHDFRRTFIGNLLDSGADLATAQALVGHVSPITTSKYDRRPSAKRKAAVERLRIPKPEELSV